MAHSTLHAAEMASFHDKIEGSSGNVVESSPWLHSRCKLQILRIKRHINV